MDQHPYGPKLDPPILEVILIFLVPNILAFLGLRLDKSPFKVLLVLMNNVPNNPRELIVLGHNPP